MRILIAEDDLTARTLLLGMLKKWEYDVVAAKDGLAAWDALQQPDAPRLVILDWVMPQMDGLEVIKLARAHFTEQPPYIILLTSKDEKGDIISGLEAGANDFIKKPFDHEELYARIRVGQRTIELQTKLYETQKSLAHLATHDPLTGIMNRRAILEQLNRELSRARRTGSSLTGAGLSIAFFDIDHFKRINDQYGHQAGDEVLIGIANIFRNNLRLYDSFSRLGGDEFLVVTPDIDQENRQNLFERLRKIVAESIHTTCCGEVAVTVSIGVATASPHNSEDELLNLADTAMYQAKRDGGNRVVYA
jgi:two-component system cell cycle response regulator